jgi:hypothetical protein
VHMYMHRLVIHSFIAFELPGVPGRFRLRLTTTVS